MLGPDFVWCKQFVPCWFLAGSFVINGLIHMFVDNLKANKFKINLIQDQSIHLVQILVTVLLFYYV